MKKKISILIFCFFPFLGFGAMPVTDYALIAVQNEAMLKELASGGELSPEKRKEIIKTKSTPGEINKASLEILDDILSSLNDLNALTLQMAKREMEEDFEKNKQINHKEDHFKDDHQANEVFRHYNKDKNKEKFSWATEKLKDAVRQARAEALKY